MNGLELSRAFYEQYGKSMLEGFPELLPHIAVGFVGSGSERFGFDDDISRDHDFEAGFGIYLPGEDVVDRRQAFLLERAYSKLPKEFEGVHRGLLSPVGGNRNGPIRTADFYRDKVGSPDGRLTAEQWLTLPDNAFAEATNGAVFYDGAGEFTAIRQRLTDIPADVRKKRLAGNLLVMAQAGQYNFARCLSHGEPEAAEMAVFHFTDAAVKTLCLLHGRFAPYYKWGFRTVRELGEGAAAERLSFLLCSGAAAERRYDAMEEVCQTVIGRLQEQGLTKAVCGDLEKHAYSVNDGIADSGIRNLHIMVSV